jgi:hypothetical protein
MNINFQFFYKNSCNIFNNIFNSKQKIYKIMSTFVVKSAVKPNFTSLSCPSNQAVNEVDFTNQYNSNNNSWYQLRNECARVNCANGVSSTCRMLYPEGTGLEQSPMLATSVVAGTVIMAPEGQYAEYGCNTDEALSGLSFAQTSASGFTSETINGKCCKKDATTEYKNCTWSPYQSMNKAGIPATGATAGYCSTKDGEFTALKCDPGKVMQGIRFTREGYQTYQRYASIKCCDMSTIPVASGTTVTPTPTPTTTPIPNTGDTTTPGTSTVTPTTTTSTTPPAETPAGTGWWATSSTSMKAGVIGGGILLLLIILGLLFKSSGGKSSDEQSE